MKEAFKAVEVAEDVYWVGAIDWAVRNFHGYRTDKGTTYNSFLVMGEKISLIDAVKPHFEDEMLARIASVVDPESLDFVISNHAEPDHAGGLARIIEVTKPDTIYATQMGVMALSANYALGGIESVSDEQTISLGSRELTFIETPMCHWPESMICYLHDQETLFSQDGFGMHLASYERFADQIDECLLATEAAKYYANILLPLGTAVEMAVSRLTDLGISPKIIAPDHGPIWRNDAMRIVEDYARWARQGRTNKAIIIYDTMWGSTDKMARAVGEGLAAGGARVRLMPIGGVHRSDIATEILDAGALLVGVPTLNSQMYPSLADALTYIKGLRPMGLLGAVFGSFGWSGEGVEEAAKILEATQVRMAAPPLGINFTPDDDDLRKCYELGGEVAAELADNPG